MKPPIELTLTLAADAKVVPFAEPFMSAKIDRYFDSVIHWDEAAITERAGSWGTLCQQFGQ